MQCTPHTHKKSDPCIAIPRKRVTYSGWRWASIRINWSDAPDLQSEYALTHAIDVKCV